jgi:hypothetical protein
VTSAPWPDLRAAASTAPNVSDGDRSTSTAREASVVASVMVVIATEVRTTEEAIVAKATKEATATKMAKEVVVNMAVDETKVKTTDQGAVGAKATIKSVSSGSGYFMAPAV